MNFLFTISWYNLHNKQKQRTEEKTFKKKYLKYVRLAIKQSSFHYLSILTYTAFHNDFKNQFTEIFRLKSRLYYIVIYAHIYIRPTAQVHTVSKYMQNVLSFFLYNAVVVHVTQEIKANV